MGGETLLIKEVGDILQYLIDAGVAENIFLMATTNGTVVKSPWLELTEKFQKLHLNVSIDGFDKYYEYIRYPEDGTLREHPNPKETIAEECARSPVCKPTTH